MVRQPAALRPFIGELQASARAGQNGLPDPLRTFALGLLLRCRALKKIRGARSREFRIPGKCLLTLVSEERW